MSTHAARLGEGLEEQLDQVLSDNPEVRFVILDVLQRIRAERRGNQSIYSYDYEVGQRLKTVAEKHPDVAILIVHHANKGNADALDSISGTHGLAGGVDNAFAMLTSESGFGGMELHINGRDIEDGDSIPLTKGEDGMWTLDSRGRIMQSRLSDTRQLIIEVMGQRTAAPKDLAEETGLDRNIIDKQLRRMVDRGEAIKLRRGLYQLSKVRMPEAV